MYNFNSISRPPRRSTTEISTAGAHKDTVTNSTQSNSYSKPFLNTQYLLKLILEDGERERWFSWLESEMEGEENQRPDEKI